jgi:hypothetical protein
VTGLGNEFAAFGSWRRFVTTGPGDFKFASSVISLSKRKVF